MAGLNTLQDNFVNAPKPLHLNSPGGNYPLYTITSKEGVVDTVTGTWETPILDSVGQPMKNRFGKVYGVEAEITAEIAVLFGVPIAPECPEGSTIKPVCLAVRNFTSPDGETYRRKNGVDVKAIHAENIRREKAEKARIEANKIRVKNGLSPNPPVDYAPKDGEPTPEQVDLISAASCVVDFIDVPHEVDGTVEWIKYSEDRVLEFLEAYPVAVEQITMFVLNRKKFDSPSQNGKN